MLRRGGTCLEPRSDRVIQAVSVAFLARKLACMPSAAIPNAIVVRPPPPSQDIVLGPAQQRECSWLVIVAQVADPATRERESRGNGYESALGGSRTYNSVDNRCCGATLRRGIWRYFLQTLQHGEVVRQYLHLKEP